MPRTTKAASPATVLPDVFRLKVALEHVRPPVWRRVETPDCDLFTLHAVIQEVMPWGNSHLACFIVGREERYSLDPMDEFDDKPMEAMTLGELAARGVKKFGYEYDFGDSWIHTVTFQKSVARDPAAKYPRCVDGERACPPDDCGGPFGYPELLAALADKKHPDHKHFKEWMGGPFDPEAFDLDAANARLRRLKL